MPSIMYRWKAWNRNLWEFTWIRQVFLDIYKSIDRHKYCVYTLLHFYDAQAQRGKRHPSFLELIMFDIIWNIEDQNSDFNNPEQNPRTIRFNLIVKSFCLGLNIESSCPLNVCTPFGQDLGLWKTITNWLWLLRSVFWMNHFRINILRYLSCVCNTRKHRPHLIYCSGKRGHVNWFLF